jgi:trans-aconitate 2-methyltransferase
MYSVDTKPARTYWNADVYERIGTPMRGWAQQVIDDLALVGDETVLDAGCGSGSVTFDLLQKLPRGKIYAVDSSPQMIEKLTRSIEEERLGPAGQALSLTVIPIHASLTDFTLPEPVDVIFSNAVLHWVPDDDALFACLLRAAKPGARFRAQCGGGENIKRLITAVKTVKQREPFAEYLAGTQDGRKYRTDKQAKAAMERCGWTEVRASVFESPVVFDNEDDAVLYLHTIILQDHVACLPEQHQAPYLRAVIKETIRLYGAPFVADYVRLDLWAQRPA